MLAIGFQNVRTPHRFGYVLEGLHQVHKINELFYQTFFVSLLVHTVDADRFSAFLMLVSISQTGDIYPIDNTGNFAVCLRLIPYRLQLYFHVFQAPRTFHVLPLSMADLSPLRSACFHRFRHYYETIQLLNPRKLALGFLGLD